MHDATVSTAGMRIVNLLVGKEAQTVADLIRATGVTRTAVTEQLNEWVAGGFVERTIERLPGRGRPRNRYSATKSALLLLFGNNQHLVVPAIWQAIGEVGGEDLKKKVLRRVSQSVADHYRRQVTAEDPEERFRQLAELLCQEGGIVEVREENGRVVMHKRSCPFISMLDDGRAVCCVDQEMMTAVVGRPVARTACRHDGAPCCVFAVGVNGE